MIVALRRIRFSGPEIAELLDRPLATVCAVLKREGVGRLSRLGLASVERYERARPGELVHIDVKKLGRIRDGAGKRVTGVRRNGVRRRRDAAGVDRCITGWDYVHVAVDDATRLAYAEVLRDEKAATSVAFLANAAAFFAAHGVRIQGVLTDNGSPYRSTVHAIACRAHGIRHLRTRPRRPQTNGKAERFVRTPQDGWAYGAIYTTSMASSRRRPPAHQPPEHRSGQPARVRHALEAHEGDPRGESVNSRGSHQNWFRVVSGGRRSRTRRAGSSRGRSASA